MAGQPLQVAGQPLQAGLPMAARSGCGSAACPPPRPWTTSDPGPMAAASLLGSTPRLGHRTKTKETIAVTTLLLLLVTSITTTITTTALLGDNIAQKKTTTTIVTSY